MGPENRGEVGRISFLERGGSKKKESRIVGWELYETRLSTKKGPEGGGTWARATATKGGKIRGCGRGRGTNRKINWRRGGGGEGLAV